MSQPVPSYSEDELARVVVRDFPESARAAVKALLERYGGEEWHREPLRVRMACLKLANGDLAALERAVGTACSDYRDVLADAEFPSYMRAKTEADKQKAIESDWAQLQAWFRAPTRRS